MLTVGGKGCYVLASLKSARIKCNTEENLGATTEPGREVNVRQKRLAAIGFEFLKHY